MSASRWSLLQWLLVRKDDGGFKLAVQIRSRCFSFPLVHGSCCNGGTVVVDGDGAAGSLREWMNG